MKTLDERKVEADDFITRGEFDREIDDHRVSIWIVFWIAIVALLLSINLIVATCRADTTKVFVPVQGATMTMDTTYPARVQVRVPLSRESQIDSILSHLSFRGGMIYFDCPVRIGDDSQYTYLGWGGISIKGMTLKVQQPSIVLPTMTYVDSLPPMYDDPRCKKERKK